MSTALEVSTIDGVELAEQRLRHLRDWIINVATIDQTVDAVVQIGQIREWLRIRKMSEQLRIEATRLECIALRRIGRALRDPELPAYLRTTARYLAKLTDQEFSEIVDGITRATTARALYLAKCKDDWKLVYEERGRSVGSGERTHHPVTSDAVVSGADLAAAASTLLDGISREGVPFTVQDAAARLADRLSEEVGDDYVCWHSEVAQRALRETVRDALGTANRRFDDDGPQLGTHPVPAFVTYYEDEIGWVRIPWHLAGIDQLQAMVETHEKKAAEATRAAAQLRALFDTLTAVRSNPDNVACDELLRAAGGY